ncbi:MAG: hypothetical protein ACKVXR_06495 [Planctomycetota bacterium]
MDLLGSLLLAVLAGFPGVQDAATSPGSDVWVETWRALDGLARSAPGSAARRQTAAELGSFQARRERAARKRHDRVETFRSRVLEAQLARLAQAPFRPVPDPRVPVDWLPGEAWIAAQVAGPGPTRVAAIERALTEARAAELAECLRFATGIAADDARALRLTESKQVARALQRRIQAATASELEPGHRARTEAAVLFGLVSRLAGEQAQALEVLQQRLESTRDPAARGELLVEIGRVRLAAGEDPAARRALGEALALGSPDAGWILGRSALSEGAVPRARALFRTLISNPEAGAIPSPALRGYGLSLLSSADVRVLPSRNRSVHPR